MKYMSAVGVDPGPRSHGLAKVVYNESDDEFPLRVVLANAVAMDRDVYAEISPGQRVVIEWVTSYGGAVGQSVFDMVARVGRFEREAERRQADSCRITNPDVKLHLTGRRNAQSVMPSLRAIFATFNRLPDDALSTLKGTKARPGPCYGVKGHAWDAVAVATCYMWRNGLSDVYKLRDVAPA
jgi:hypothetical protein